MTTLAEALDTLSLTTDLARHRVTQVYEEFHERNGGDTWSALKACEHIVRSVNGRPVDVGREMSRQRHHEVTGTELKLSIKAFDVSRSPFDDEYGSFKLDVRSWTGISTATPVHWRHGGQPVADVVGWQQQGNNDLLVWIQLRDNQQDIQAAALFDELSCSPGIRVRSDHTEWSGTPSDRRAIVQSAAISELSLTEAGLNRLPGATVTCEPCPAGARPKAAPVPGGNYAYRDKATGTWLHVRTWQSKVSVT
jgi:hypothetical protein